MVPETHIAQRRLAVSADPADPIAHRYFRRAFGMFVAFAVSLTLVLVGETLWLARANLKGELAIYQRTFENSIAAAVWSMDRDKLRSIVRGIVEIPDVRAVRIVDAQSGEALIESGEFPEEGDPTLSHRFQVVYDEGFGRHVVAEATFHSSLGRLVTRTQTQILLIVLIAVLKTAIIWAVFRHVGRRLVARPLREMIDSIAGATTPRPIELSPPAAEAIAGTDLSALHEAYNALAHRAAAAQAELETANEALERRVVDRTQALAEANRRLEDLANTDFLTGLANRRQFIAQAEALIARARDSGCGLALVICDLDRFKEINDDFGHAAGDRALCHVAERILGTVRQHDLPARIGGDEFVVLLPDASLNDATIIAERLRALLSTSTLKLPDGREMRITTSIGVAELSVDDQTLDDLFQRADMRLYAAKGSGRDCVANTH